MELADVLGHVGGEILHHLAQGSAQHRRGTMQLAHADDEGICIAVDEVEEQLHRLMANAPPAAEVDAQQLR
ncbi:hypothetical protein D9M71_642670 [compost metagenome]